MPPTALIIVLIPLLIGKAVTGKNPEVVLKAGVDASTGVQILEKRAVSPPGP
jgi:hypothetical protein